MGVENDGGAWTAHDMDICITIQNAYEKQHPWLDLSSLGFCYLIYFNSISQMNRQTRRRRLRRRLDLAYPLTRRPSQVAVVARRRQLGRPNVPAGACWSTTRAPLPTPSWPPPSATERPAPRRPSRLREDHSGARRRAFRLPLAPLWAAPAAAPPRARNPRRARNPSAPGGAPTPGQNNLNRPGPRRHRRGARASIPPG